MLSFMLSFLPKTQRAHEPPPQTGQHGRNGYYVQFVSRSGKERLLNDLNVM
jgi:hypothetical protein